MRRFLVAAFLLACSIASAAAQVSLLNLPANTLVGRLGIGTGPGQAIPITTIETQLINTSAPSVPRLWQSLATNCDSGHHLWWLDENFCATWNQSFVVNDDPSVLVAIPIGGTAGPTGATQTLTFTFGAGVCATGCPATYTFQAFSITSSISGTTLTVTSLPGANTMQIGQAITGAGVTAGTVVTGPVPGQTWAGGIGTYTVNNSQTVASETMTATDTLNSIAWGLSNAIKNNVNIFNPTATNTSQQKQIIWSTANTVAAQVSLDIDGRTALKVTTSNTGGSTVTSTPPGTCGTACAVVLDVGTSINYTRSLPFVPLGGSNIFQTFFAAPATAGSGVYGQITVNIADPAISLGSIFLSGQWNSAITSGVYVSRGLYSVSQSDQGADTADFSAYYTNGASGLKIAQPGGSGTALNIFNQSAASLVLGTSNAARLTINSAGTTFVNLNTGNISLDGATVFGTAALDSTANEIELQAFGATTVFVGKRINGTNALPTTLVSGSLITALAGEGYDGTSTGGPAAQVQLIAAGTWTNTSHPSKIDLYVTPAASITQTLALEINSDGGTTLGSPTGGDKGAYTFNTQGLIYVNGSAVGASAISPAVLNATTGAISIAAPWNVTTLTSNGVLYGNSTGTVQATAQGSNRSVLVGNAGVPTFSATPSITSLTLDNGTANGLQFTAASGSNGALAMGVAGTLVFVLGSAVDSFAVNDHLAATVLNIQEVTPGTTSTTQTTLLGDLVLGVPTGGHKGNGTLNIAGAYYANGTIGVTCNAGFSVTTGRSVNGIVTAC